MAENIHKGKIYSFWKLLSGTRIEVPIIQRDYAQGRIDEQEIRDNFLNALFISLHELKPIKLDFIYGSIHNNVLQPLDGQQRLTTLFLLHWYSSIKDNSNSKEIKSILSQFTYETRISSREFCTELVEKGILFNTESENLRSIIIDSPWFVLSWEKDPTIDAMLRTIDSIHEKFKSIFNLWEKLIADDCLISFYHVELKNIGLTDDLYIKMNARGKLLSPFENFKASFQKHINDSKWEHNLSFPETFACKIDTEWTDLLWAHKKEFSIDEPFMRFASAIAMIRLALEKSESSRASLIQNLQENPNALRPEMISGSGFQYLTNCFNIYVISFASEFDLSLNFNLWQHTPNNSIFTSLVYEDNLSSFQKNSASYSQKVLFFAQTEYLLRVKEFNSEKFQDWMRVIRNIISRGDVTKFADRPALVRSPNTFIGVIGLVNEIAIGCEDIYRYLANLVSPSSSFAKDQIEEEILKAKLITKLEGSRSVIFDLEENNLLRGRISFPLYCADYNIRDKQGLDFLKKIEIVFSRYFNNEADVPNKLRRALLSIEVDGEYKYYTYWWSFWNVANATKRCLIDKYRELEFYIQSGHKDYFKKLILGLIDRTLDDIINEFVPPSNMPNWKVRLIKEANLLDTYCKSHYIAIPEDESCCYLLKSIRPRDLQGCEVIS